MDPRGCYGDRVRHRLLASAVVLASLAPGLASAQARYRGPHPVDLDGHWHLEDAEHVHDGLSVGEAPFGVVDEVRVFLGDPLAYGYDGEVWTYTQAHPLPGGLNGYCGVTQPHRHPFAPDGRYRRERSGGYAYVGGMRGGRAMAVPSRLTPRTPVIAPAPPIAPTAPFLWAGCLHRLDPGSRGGVRLVQSPGCAAIVGPFGRARDAPPPGRGRGSYFDGNYGRVRRSPDLRVVRGADAPRQK